MQIQTLAEYWQEIETTSSRLAMTEILARLLKEISVEEIKAVTYMSLGKLGPAYLTAEFGVAEKMLIRVFAQIFLLSEVSVMTLFKEVGDLGEVFYVLYERQGSGVRGQVSGITAALVGHQIGFDLQTAESTLEILSDVTILSVYKQLHKVSQIQGAGSQEGKVGALASIFRSLDGLSGKFVARLVLGRMRLGFSDMTLLDGLSWMVTGDKSLHAILEHGYNVMADVGDIARIVKSSHGVDDVKKKMTEVHIRLGVPVVSALCQREETFDAIVEDLKEVACEPKFDGTRVQIHFKRHGKDWKVRTFTRNMEESSQMFPELARIGEQLLVDEVVLDGEAMGYDSVTGNWLLFAQTMTRKRKHGIEEAAQSVPLRFMVFDVLYVSGLKDGILPDGVMEGDCHMLPLNMRRKILENIVLQGALLVVTDQSVSSDAEFLREKHADYLAQGLEGAILKGTESVYIPGRKGAQWIKMKEVEHARGKLSDTIDCVVMGYDYGQGKRAALGVGSLLLGVKSGESYVTLCKLGTGMSDEQLLLLKNTFLPLVVEEIPKDYIVNSLQGCDVWLAPEVVIEVAGDELTKSPSHSSGWGLRFPRMIRVRDDKGIEGVTEMEELGKIRMV